MKLVALATMAFGVLVQLYRFVAILIMRGELLGDVDDYEIIAGYFSYFEAIFKIVGLAIISAIGAFLLICAFVAIILILIGKIPEKIEFFIYAGLALFALINMCGSFRCHDVLFFIATLILTFYALLSFNKKIAGSMGSFATIIKKFGWFVPAGFYFLGALIGWCTVGSNMYFEELIEDYSYGFSSMIINSYGIMGIIIDLIMTGGLLALGFILCDKIVSPQNAAQQYGQPQQPYTQPQQPYTQPQQPYTQPQQPYTQQQPQQQPQRPLFCTRCGSRLGEDGKCPNCNK